jgi:ATP-dependent protease ClpP protease subunit
MNEVLVYGSIYDFTAEAFVRSFSEIEGNELTCRIKTNGGGVEAAWSMIGKWKEFEGQKTVKVDGKAYSMGFYFCCYADNVQCLDVSQFMVHRASYGEWYENSTYFTEAEKVNLTNVNKQLKAAFEAKVDVQTFENLKSVKDAGITVEKVEGVNLIKFTDELHTRLEELLEKRKAQLLTAAEEAEYAGIAELERILTFINAKLIANRDN